jgi:hypothetical protein
MYTADALMSIGGVAAAHLDGRAVVEVRVKLVDDTLIAQHRELQQTEAGR